MLVSVITVCYNPQIDGLKKTILSVVDGFLSSRNIEMEYIIIDGGSTNGAIDLINKVILENNDIKIKLIVEADDGIYDAMNKGIYHSNGDWLIFMNSGDSFSDKKTLVSCVENFDEKKAIIYGDMISNSRIVKAHPLSYLEKGIMMACHQSMFFNRKLIGSELKYNLEFPIYADYELVVRILTKIPGSMLYNGLVVANYEGGGVSDTISLQKRKDKYRIVYMYYGMAGVLKSIFHRIFSR
ncbi:MULTISPECIES: glycosyltransferase [Vibrio]|uniref:glycosyltransferase n=1 Tax=Vibrio TaxID=662 RepID=UPI0011D88B68|nr:MULTISPECIES: glycosyltransferase [Vibrio]EKO3762831.1 glycosyltransferase [Vibrio metschnikovii]EKO3797148.1 glycosyltransferase [Vibrio metschnikovii]MBC3621523.1 glycosyltransferase [Vibrio metschnikovii]TXX39798.1 glycosyltransferase [Vibrio cholerae]BCN18170.1 putative glycosyltransferase [Vibrio cholerae]